MSKLINSIHEIENNFNTVVDKFLFHHPFLGGLLVFIGMPISIIIAVTVCTTIVVFPLALIFGWY